MHPVSVYKKFSPEDFSYIPFNANKQYNFNSSSVASNGSITHYSAKYTSESISLYSSASSVSIWSGQTGSFDPINTIKYNQLDHLFYRDYKKDLNNRFGDWHYLKQKRTLYENVNILSIPAGLYGHKIKKGEFILSSSNPNFSQSNGYGIELKDDGHGNLYDTSINRGHYVTDIRKNLFNIGPVKGFKKYDLETYDGYVKVDGYKKMQFWRRGKQNPNAPSTYSSFDHLDEFDDSYYFNNIKYKGVRFSEKPLYIRKFTGSLNGGGYPDITLGNPIVLEGDFFPTIDMGRSEIRMGHDEKFNFNPLDNFTISFWIKNSEIGNGWVVDGSSVYDDENQKQYIISKSTTKKVITPITNKSGNPPRLNASHSLQEGDVFAESQFPFEVYIEEPEDLDGKHIFFKRSDGGVESLISGSLKFTDNNPFMQHITCMASESIMKIYVNGTLTGSIDDPIIKHTENTADLFIGNQGGFKNFFNGSLSQINIFNKALSQEEVTAHYSSSNGSPYAGNIFYSHGLATITHPKYIGFLSEYNSPPQEEQESLNFTTQLFYKDAVQLETLEDSYSEQDVRDVAFKPDGTRMYVLGQHDKTIKAYKLTKPWDVTSAQYLSVLDATTMKFTNTVDDEVGAAHDHPDELQPVSFDFHRDGNQLIFIGQTNRRLYELNFSSPWDITTVTNVSKSVSMSNFSDNGGPDPFGNPSTIDGTKYLSTFPSCIRYSDNGGKLCTTISENTSGQNRLIEIKLGSTFNIATLPTFTDNGDLCIECKSIDLEDITGKPLGLCEYFDFNSSGKQFVFKAEDTTAATTSSLHQVYLTSSFNIDSFIPSGYYKNIPVQTEQPNSGFHGIRWEETDPAIGKNDRIYAVSDSTVANASNKFIVEYQFKKPAIENLEFKGNHLIFEHEYRCSVEENDFNETLNVTARKIPKTSNDDMADFATSSLFKPYVTTIGLYNEDNELLVVGKLGQPIRMSDETDSHFIVRWDT
jgi:hypothetical protein